MSVTAIDRAPHTHWTTIAGPSLRLAPGAERHGLAVALREIVALNVRDRPLAARAYRRLDIVATVRLTDMALPLTLDFRRGRLTVHAGASPRPADVAIVTDARGLISFAEAPKLAGVPDLRTREGRLVVRRLLSGRLRLRGVVRHPLAMLAVALLCDAHRDDRGEWPPR
ncbi:MAG TPA: hypothetical protein VFZ89_02800 [Solirubrobacteraceae bacterium]